MSGGLLGRGQKPLPITPPRSGVRKLPPLYRGPERISSTLEGTLFPPDPPEVYDQGNEQPGETIVIRRSTAKAISNLLIKYRAKMGEQRAIDDILEELA